jgi:curved DNA-binding protein CbpA
MSADPYATLGLKKDATADDIRKAYRKIARTSHPDLNPDDPAAEAKFKQASAAHDLLKDPDRRARYDRGEIDASGAERPQQREIRHRFEQIGLAMPVLAHDHQPGRGNLEVELREITVVLGGQAGEHVGGAISAR